MRSLLPPPRTVLDPATGAPRFGSYCGELPRVELAPLRAGKVLSFAHRKRWIFTAIASGDLFLAGAIVHLGYVASAFFFAYDGGAGRLLVDRSHLTLPLLAAINDRPGPGCAGRFTEPLARTSLRVERPEDAAAYAVSIRAPGVALRARLDAAAAPPPIGAIAALAGPPEGLVQITQKRALLAVAGEVSFGGSTRALDGGLAGIDTSYGHVPRRTAWRWAFALGRAKSGERVALNLVEGFVGEAECALWIDGELFPLREGRFAFDAARPRSPWRVRTADERVDLRFEPGALHTEHRDLGVVASHYVQPVGSFAGTIHVEGRAPIELERVLGVVEDQRVRW
ncbi:DUF2804 family protein [Sorangium sp. So ce1036]|uniref:DUF2804 family protein n=1 Tax=Sorangium sp. So ce1036 TaxID=3133328 RepID=UPI003F021370